MGDRNGIWPVNLCKNLSQLSSKVLSVSGDRPGQVKIHPLMQMTTGKVTILWSSYSTLELLDADVLLGVVAPPAALRLSDGRVVAAPADALLLSVMSESLSCWFYIKQKQTTIQWLFFQDNLGTLVPDRQNCSGY